MKYIPGQITDYIDKVLHTDGKEYMTLNGTEYIGNYFINAFGIYSCHMGQTSATMRKERLVPFVDDKDYLEYIRISNGIRYVDCVAPVACKPKPSKRDYELGFFYRYFCQRRNTNEIIEIDDRQYRVMGSSPNSINIDLYRNLSILWVISGPKTDIISAGNIILVSAATQNKKNLIIADKEMHGIYGYLSNNLSEYVKYQ